MSTQSNIVNFEIQSFGRRPVAHVTIVFPYGIDPVREKVVERSLRQAIGGRLSGPGKPLPPIRLVALATSVEGDINEPAADGVLLPVSKNGDTRVVLGAVSEARCGALVRRYRLNRTNVTVAESRSGFLSTVAERLVTARLAAA